MSLSQIAAMISCLETMFEGGEGELKEMWWRCWWQKRNVMVSIEEGKLMKTWWWKENIEAFLKKNEHQPLPETQTIITHPMGKVGNVVTLCVLWYTPCCTHKPRPQQDYNDQAHEVCYANPNSHRRTVNNYLLYNIGVNIPYTVACKPSHLLAPKVISPSACKQKHTSVYKFFPRI